MTPLAQLHGELLMKLRQNGFSRPVSGVKLSMKFVSASTGGATKRSFGWLHLHLAIKYFLK